MIPWSSPTDVPVGPRAFRPIRPRPGTPGGPVDVSDAHHYAVMNGDLVVAVGLANVNVLQQPDGVRNLLIIRNSSATQNLYVSFGNQASVNSTIRLVPNAIILFDASVPQDDVNVVADAAGGQVSIAYSTI